MNIPFLIPHVTIILQALSSSNSSTFSKTKKTNNEDEFTPISVEYLNLKNLTDFDSTSPSLYSDIRGISLENCRLSKMPLKFMRSFRNLREIELKNNRIKNWDFEKWNAANESFMSRLEKFQVERTEINQLLNDSFVRYKSLEYLSLICTGLSEIEDNAFNGLKFLEYLDLSRNNLQNFSGRIFEPLGNLKILNLRYNKISSADIFGGIKLPNLITLHLENNPTMKVDQKEVLINAPNLKHFKFCRGLIKPCNVIENVC